MARGKAMRRDPAAGDGAAAVPAPRRNRDLWLAGGGLEKQNLRTSAGLKILPGLPVRSCFLFSSMGAEVDSWTL
jgi:hypothetical protein